MPEDSERASSASVHNDVEKRNDDQTVENVLTLDEIIRTNKPNSFGKGYLKMYGICAIVFLASTSSGFDGSLMGSINALPEYQDYFNLNGAAKSTGIIFSIWNIGQMVAAFFMWSHDWLGRRKSMFVGAIGIIVGAIMVSTTNKLSVFIGGRFLLAFFCSLSITAAPLYIVEITPPHLRASIAGLYNTLFYLGSIIATFSIYGVDNHYTGSTKTFKIPLWLQLLCPGLMAIGLIFIPESPRWLASCDRHEEARRILVSLHANGDETHPLVDLEYAEIMDSMKESGLTTWRQFLDYSALVKTRSARYKTMLTMCMAWFGQFSGNSVISYYLPTMLAAVGIKKTGTKLLLNAIYSITGWIAAITGARMHDVIGRRKMLLGSTIGCVICFAIISATTAHYQHTKDKKSSSASIAFIYIFGSVFAAGYTSMQPIYPSEVLSNDIRAKGMFVYKITSGAAGFVNAYASPLAMQNITYWYYVFFTLWDIIEVTVIYFLFVETKGRTLEELEEIFNAPNPRKYSTQLVPKTG